MPLLALPRSRPGRHGYTLLEMLIVLAILAVMIGLGWPAIQKMARRSRIGDAAKQVRNALGQARLAAIESGKAQVFRFQPGAGRFEIAARQEEDAGPAVLRSALDQMAEAAASPRPAAADPQAGPRDLPGGIVFAGQ
ncbi:MAG: prepilin-type N-terminal cleavage/methylation domain-containing protein, partial [Planctomycetota bacterium]|nr:prepilin-type N-terminal cleavage/methylation domain-containing protein [Planctomycetota bacterium]